MFDSVRIHGVSRTTTTTFAAYVIFHPCPCPLGPRIEFLVQPIFLMNMKHLGLKHTQSKQSWSPDGRKCNWQKEKGVWIFVQKIYGVNLKKINWKLCSAECTLQSKVNQNTLWEGKDQLQLLTWKFRSS